MLLVSTDPAHSTSDIFERQFTREEREILPNLFGLEIDADFEASRYIAEVKEQVSKMFSPSMVGAASRQIDLAAAMPGCRRRGALRPADDDHLGAQLGLRSGHLRHRADRPHRPPAADARDAARLDRRAGGAAAPRGRARSPTRAATTAGKTSPIRSSSALERRRQRLDEVRARLVEHRDTSFVLVLIPERLPIEETSRAAGTLAEAGIEIGAIVVNRVLPDGLSGEFYAARRRQEDIYRREIDHRFKTMDRIVIAQLESDVYGLNRLERISAQIIG